MMCAEYQYNDSEGYAMTGGGSGVGASPRSEAAVFHASAIAVAKCGGLGNGSAVVQSESGMIGGDSAIGQR